MHRAAAAAGSAPAGGAGHGGGAAAVVVPFCEYPFRGFQRVSEWHETREAHGVARPHMEDKVGGFEMPNRLDGAGLLSCLYVVDGHGGADASTFIRGAFQRIFEAQVDRFAASALPTSLKGVLFATLAQVEFELQMRQHQAEAHGRRLHDGAVAAFVVLRSTPAGRKLYCANVGDVEVVLAEKGRAPPSALMSTKHNFTNAAERERIERVSGRPIASAGDVRTGRVFGMAAGSSLAVTRSFADFAYKPWVSAEPTISEVVIEDKHAFVVIASDGVFDYLPPSETAGAITEFLERGNSRANAAQALLAKANPARMAGPLTRDNASAIVAFF